MIKILELLCIVAVLVCVFVVAVAVIVYDSAEHLIIRIKRHFKN